MSGSKETFVRVKRNSAIDFVSIRDQTAATWGPIAPVVVGLMHVRCSFTSFLRASAGTSSSSKCKHKFSRTQALLATFACFSTFVLAGMVSYVDRAGRALVTLLNQLAVFYNLVLGVTRDSTVRCVVRARRCLKGAAVEATSTKEL